MGYTPRKGQSENLISYTFGMLRLKVLALAFFATIMGSFFVALPANAAPGSGALTIVASGGSAAGTGWTYTAGVIEVTSNSAVSIDASEIVSRLNANLTVSANSILVSADIISNSASDLTLQALGNINVSGGFDIITQGGDITFQSDSDDSGVGSIRLGSESDSSTGLVHSNGGRIIFSGGTNPLTDYAMASSDFSSTKPAAGVAGFGFDVDASGGDIIIRGSSGPNTGITTRGILFENNAVSGVAGRQLFETSGSGTITLNGDGSQIGFNNPWGITTSGAVFRTVSGDISLTGKANTAIANARGLALSNTTFASTTGNIFWDDTTNGTASNYSGTYVGGTLTDISTLGNIVIRADEYISDGTLKFTGPSAVMKPYTGTSFTESRPLGLIDATNCQNFVFGQTGNTTKVDINQPITFGGPASFYGGQIEIKRTLTSSSSNIFLFASGAVTQTAAIISNGLGLMGSGPFTLNNSSNNIGTLAGGSSGSRLGAVSVTDSTGGLTIGQVSSLLGIYSSGVINIATLSGNMTISQPVSSTAASTDSVLLYADKDAAASAAGDGNIILAGSGSVSNAASARALLYSGVRGSSTGLVDLVGGEDNTRSLVASTTALNTISPSLGSTGQFALFRTNTPSPTYTVTYDANQSNSGSVPSPTSSTTAQTVAGNTGSLERTGFTFAGWNTQADGDGTNYAVGVLITPSADVTLYAKWTAIPAPSPSPTPNVTPASLPSTGFDSTPLLLSATLLFIGAIFLGLSTIRRKP